MTVHNSSFLFDVSNDFEWGPTMTFPSNTSRFSPRKFSPTCTKLSIDVDMISLRCLWSMSGVRPLKNSLIPRISKKDLLADFNT